MSQTGVATADQFSIPSVIQTIDAQIKALGNLETTKYKTDMKLGPFGDLKKEMNVEKLIKAFSFVRGKANAYAESAKQLGVENAPAFKEEGSTLAEWEHDIKFQINLATHKDKLEELKKLKAEAQQFVSEEDKRKMFIEKLMGSPALQSGK